MTGIQLSPIQLDITNYIKSSIPQFTVETGGIPTAESLPFVNGRLEPYIILRFSEGMPSAADTSFNGPIYDGYYSYVDALCLGETDKDARDLANLVSRYMLGKKFPNASAMRKNFGGGQFAIFAEANRNPVAFIIPASFRFEYNIEDVGAGSLAI